MEILKINNLFGKNDYTIDLSDRCIVFIGENGTGKTTILKIISSLLSNNYVELSKYKFDSIELQSGEEHIRYEFYQLMPQISKSSIGHYEDGVFIKDELEDDFDLLFSNAFIDECKSLISPNRFAWILSCLYHEKRMDPSDIFLLEQAKINAYALAENRYVFSEHQYIGNFDVCKLLKAEIQTRTLCNGLPFSLPYDDFCSEPSYLCKIFTHSEIDSSLYRSLFSNNSKHDEENSFSRKRYYDAEAELNTTTDTFMNMITINKRLMNIQNSILVDMTKTYSFAQYEYRESYLRIGSNEMSTLAKFWSNISHYESQIPEYRSYPKLYQALNNTIYEAYSIALKSLENQICRSRENAERELKFPSDHFSIDISQYISDDGLIQINRIISENFFYRIAETKINFALLSSYFKTLNRNTCLILQECDDTTNKVLAEFFFAKQEELQEWFGSILYENSVFDFNFRQLMYRNSFFIQHQIFYNFYLNEFQSIKNEISNKTKTFIQALSKFLYKYEIEATPARIRFLDKNKNEIDPNDFSSGEKKILVILIIAFYGEDVLILFDEPEISFSVIWQSILLPTLLNDSDIKKIIVATHSPFIVENDDMLKYLNTLS